MIRVPTIVARLDGYRPSLRRWSRACAILWLASAGIAAPIAVGLLDQIYNDAQKTYTKEIPDLLDRNRNAVKLERLASFVRAIASDPDPREERRTLVQLQTLAQGFDLDNDARLNQGTALVIANARKIVALRRGPTRGDGPSSAPGLAEPDSVKAVRRLRDDSLQALAELADYVTTDAALKADQMASRIQSNAVKVKYGCLAALAFFIAFGMVLFRLFQKHVLRPIAAAVRGLEAVRTADDGTITLDRARFFELDMIGRSVEQYAGFAADLRSANAALRRLSDQDGLTGLDNRRAFDASLGAACHGAARDRRPFALLLIDIDHFKHLNDRFGHLAGDRCLQMVGAILNDLCTARLMKAARYGGEEFAAILYDVSEEEAADMAEAIRRAIASASIAGPNHPSEIGVTTSIGIAHVAAERSTVPSRIIEEADEALYRAKRSGRNRVHLATSDLTVRPAANG